MKEMLTKRSFEPITNCNCKTEKEIEQDFKKHEEKHKQIEEMAKIIEDGCANIKCNEKCKYYNDEPYICYTKRCAETILDLGYRKIDKDSVVITREEYSKELNDSYYQGQHECEIYYKNIQIPRERKETAEKFADLLFSHITTREVWEELRTLWLRIGGGKKANLPIWNLLIEPVLKQFGVEIKE